MTGLPLHFPAGDDWRPSMLIESISIAVILLFRFCRYDVPDLAGSSNGGTSH
jgi:hypothetical protein